MQPARKTLLLESIADCSSWDDIHAKWAAFSKEDKGARFEDLTQAFLQVHETYAKEFVNIWRPDEVPAAIAKKLKLRVPEWGIDLVGETRSGEFWSIQCKYLQDTDQELSHRIIASSVATTFESSRGFSYLLVCTTTQRVTNHYDHNPKVLFYGLPIWQQIDAAFLDTLRSKLAGKKVALTPYSPRKHQINAIQDGLKHFKDGTATRGKLIMPCGTGKSLTAWFLSQALGSTRVVIALPSLSLVKQTLGVWTREAYHNNVAVDWICVCSDETAGRAEQDDAAIKVKDLGVPCLTSPDEIAKWLKAEHKGLTVVFTTYQSGQVLATAARKAKFAFDLGIMDEAHKTVGDGDKLFSHLIHEHNIEIRQRVFMTATERRFSGSSDKILSMDDPEVYGETFHLLTFKKAMEVIEGERPILCDYNVITIGVSRQEVKELIQKNLFVRPDSGKWDEDMEADMLAAMVALRKAMQDYPIKHAVSFHGSIKRAEQFRQYNDSFTEEFPSFGQLSTFHVSGQTPTGTRSNIIKQFAKADRSLVTNARCLTEGVDVPSIDCVLFADPKKSKVDIVQAVGRALRPAPGKKLGYVILPELHDEDSGELKESGSFKEVIQVLTTLASQDERIIDEFRAISEGRKPAGSGRVRFDFGERISANIDIAQFTRELQIKCWNRLAKLSWRAFEDARKFVRRLGLKTQKDWLQYVQNGISGGKGKPADIPSNPHKTYALQGWVSMSDWIGSDFVHWSKHSHRSFKAAKTFVHSLQLKTGSEWKKYCSGLLSEKPTLPLDIPKNPERVYQDEGWTGMGDWLGTGNVAFARRKYRDFESAREFAQRLTLKTYKEWLAFARGELDSKVTLPADIPVQPDQTYKKKGWRGYGDWLGTGSISVRRRFFRPFADARSFARSLKLKNSEEWKMYCKGGLPGKSPLPNDIPSNPNRTYAQKGWRNMGDWLGSGKIAPGERAYLPFSEARSFVQKLRLKNYPAWRSYFRGERVDLPPLPSNIPAYPNQTYANNGWIGLGDWLGTGFVAAAKREYRKFGEAREFARSLKLRGHKEWTEFCKKGRDDGLTLPQDIPVAPDGTYHDKGWSGWGDWIGTGNIAKFLLRYRSIEEAKDFAKSLELKSQKEWKLWRKNGGVLPTDIPANPHLTYAKKGWQGWSDFLSTGVAARAAPIAFEEAREIARGLGLKNLREWQRYSAGKDANRGKRDVRLPSSPDRHYISSGWKDWGDWLGTGVISNKKKLKCDFSTAREFVRSLGLKTKDQWAALCKTSPSNLIERGIPFHPAVPYKNEGWISWGDWLGNGTISNKNKVFMPFEEARHFARSLGLKTASEWRLYSSGEARGLPARPDNMPSSPERQYSKEGWISWSDWLGTKL
jgi:superfamily II DNA or RNA helicase